MSNPAFLKYHDDGEFGLGPTIATLSLGASSTMFIRMKGKYYSGLQENGNLLKEDPVLPGCDKYDSRKGLRDQFRQGIITEKQYDEKRLKILDKYKAPPPIIKMETHHGHLIVMHGDSLQKYYEVSFHFSWKGNRHDSNLALFCFSFEASC